MILEGKVWRTCGAWWIREPGYACSQSRKWFNSDPGG